MALAIALRAACPKQASPLLLPIARLGSTTSCLSTNAAFQRLLVQASVKPIGSVRPISLAAIRRSAAAVAGSPGHHAKLWTVERAISAGLLVALPAAIAFPSQPLDIVVAVSMVMHAHWGLEAIVVDYVRPILVGNVVPKVAHFALIAFSAATLGGLVYFIQNDVGIGNAVRQLWAIRAKPEAAPDAKKK